MNNASPMRAAPHLQTSGPGAAGRRAIYKKLPMTGRIGGIRSVQDTNALQTQPGHPVGRADCGSGIGITEQMGTPIAMAIVAFLLIGKFAKWAWRASHGDTPRQLVKKSKGRYGPALNDPEDSRLGQVKKSLHDPNKFDDEIKRLLEEVENKPDMSALHRKIKLAIGSGMNDEARRKVLEKALLEKALLESQEATPLRERVKKAADEKGGALQQRLEDALIVDHEYNLLRRIKQALVDNQQDPEFSIQMNTALEDRFWRQVIEYPGLRTAGLRKEILLEFRDQKRRFGTTGEEEDALEEQSETLWANKRTAAIRLIWKNLETIRDKMLNDLAGRVEGYLLLSREERAGMEKAKMDARKTRENWLAEIRSQTELDCTAHAADLNRFGTDEEQYIRAVSEYRKQQYRMQGLRGDGTATAPGMEEWMGVYIHEYLLALAKVPGFRLQNKEDGLEGRLKKFGFANGRLGGMTAQQRRLLDDETIMAVTRALQDLNLAVHLTPGAVEGFRQAMSEKKNS